MFNHSLVGTKKTQANPTCSVSKNPLFSDLRLPSEILETGNKNTGKAGLKPEKKRLATPWFPASIFPTDSDRKASFCRQLGVLPSCSSDDRPWPSGGSFDGNSHRPGGTCTPRWKSKGHFPRPPVTTFFPSRRRCQPWFGGK